MFARNDWQSLRSTFKPSPLFFVAQPRPLLALEFPKHMLRAPTRNSKPESVRDAPQNETVRIATNETEFLDFLFPLRCCLADSFLFLAIVIQSFVVACLVAAHASVALNFARLLTREQLSQGFSRGRRRIFRHLRRHHRIVSCASCLIMNSLFLSRQLRLLRRKTFFVPSPELWFARASSWATHKKRRQREMNFSSSNETQKILNQLKGKSHSRIYAIFCCLNRGRSRAKRNCYHMAPRSDAVLCYAVVSPKLCSSHSPLSPRDATQMSHFSVAPELWVHMKWAAWKIQFRSSFNIDCCWSCEGEFVALNRWNGKWKPKQTTPREI